MYALIGIGPNGLEIPLLVCASWDDALGYLVKHLKNDAHLAPIHGENFPRNENFAIRVNFDDIIDKDENGSEEILNKFFRNGRYDNGCGDCYKIKVSKIEFEEPMVGWSLD